MQLLIRFTLIFAVYWVTFCFAIEYSMRKHLPSLSARIYQVLTPDGIIITVLCSGICATATFLMGMVLSIVSPPEVATSDIMLYLGCVCAAIMLLSIGCSMAKRKPLPAS